MFLQERLDKNLLKTFKLSKDVGDWSLMIIMFGFDTTACCMCV